MSEDVRDSIRRTARNSLALVSAREPLVRAQGHTEAADRLREYACHLEAIFTARDQAELQVALQNYVEFFDLYEPAWTWAVRSFDEGAADA